MHPDLTRQLNEDDLRRIAARLDLPLAEPDPEPASTLVLGAAALLTLSLAALWLVGAITAAQVFALWLAFNASAAAAAAVLAAFVGRAP